MSIVRIKAPSSVLAPFISFVYDQIAASAAPDSSDSSDNRKDTSTDTPAPSSTPTSTPTSASSTPTSTPTPDSSTSTPTLMLSDDNSYIEIEGPAVLFEGFFAVALMNLPQQDSGDPESAE